MGIVSSILEDYLEAIFTQQTEQGVARVKEISRILGVTPPTVVSAIRRLAADGYVEHEHYGYVRLTIKGRQIAEKVYGQHNALLRFLVEILGIPHQKAFSQACGMEHSIARETRFLLERLAKFFESNPDIFKRWCRERCASKY